MIGIGNFFGQAKSEMIRPAVLFSAAASSLTAVRTSSSMSSAVHMHRMLLHLMR
jgi:hypothetical protein